MALWVFGYGSLMWEPGFRAAEVRRARLEGWHRSFCMWSIHYRGTEADPGLVLALDRAEGRVCEGLAFRIAAEEAEEVHAYLRERELISSAYEERRLPVTLADGREVEALAYVISHGHPQHCTGMDAEAQAQVIVRARGERGANRDYLANTVAHLRETGIADEELEWLAARVRQLSES